MQNQTPVTWEQLKGFAKFILHLVFLGGVVVLIFFIGRWTMSYTVPKVFVETEGTLCPNQDGLCDSDGKYLIHVCYENDSNWCNEVAYITSSSTMTINNYQN